MQEVVAERVFTVDPVLAYHGVRHEQTALFVVAYLHLVLDAVVALVEHGFHALTPGQQIALAAQQRFVQLRLIDQLGQHGFRRAARHAGDQVSHRAMLVDQTLQRLATDGRSGLVDMQSRTVQRHGSLVLQQRVFVFQILLLLALLHLVERRLGDVDVATLDDFRHLTIEEGQQQGTNVSTINVRIGHDDDVVITQLVRVVLVTTDATAQRGDQGAHLLGGDHLVETGLLHVQDLALERQDGLVLPVATLLGGTASRVPFHYVEFGERRVFFLTVSQLAGQTGDIQRAFAASQFAGLAGRLTGTGRIDDLVDHDLGIARVFQQEVGQLLTHRLFDGGLHFGRDQLVLGLGGELGIRHLDGDNGNQTFTHVVATGGRLGLLAVVLFVHVGVQSTGQRGTEAHQVGTTIALRNVVGEAVDPFLIGVVPLHRHFDADAVLLGGEVEHLRVDRGFVLVQVFNERLDAAFVAEVRLAAVTLIQQADGDAGVEEGELTQTLGQDLVVEQGIAEDGRARPEADFGPGAGAVANLLEWCLRLTQVIGLLVDMAVATDGQQQLVREGVYHGDADTVQAAGDLVGVVVKLAARVQHGHDDFGSGATLFRVDVDRNTTTVVTDGDGAVGMDLDLNIGAVAGQSLVNGVVDDLEHHVVQTRAIIRIADIHPRALADRIQALQYLDIRGVVSIFTHSLLSAFSNVSEILPCSTWNNLQSFASIMSAS